MTDIDISKYMCRFRRDTIYVQHKTTAPPNSMGAILAASGAETALSCGIQPVGGSLTVAEYGECAGNMLIVFADPVADVRQGDLARVYAADKADYRVTSVRAWRSYTRIDLEKM